MEVIYRIIAVLIPASMLAIGLLWRFLPPKFRSKGLAYATSLSSASPEAWAFAHRHCAKLWTRIGAILLVITVVLLSLFSDSAADFVLWLIGGQMVLFCLSAFLVDLLLKNTFHEDGTPIK